MKPIKNLMWMSERKEEERKKEVWGGREGGTQFAITSPPSVHTVTKNKYTHQGVAHSGAL